MSSLASLYRSALSSNEADSVRERGRFPAFHIAG